MRVRVRSMEGLGVDAPAGELAQKCLRRRHPCNEFASVGMRIRVNTRRSSEESAAAHKSLKNQLCCHQVQMSAPRVLEERDVGT